MEDWEEDFDHVVEPDYKLITKNFLEKQDFKEWHLWAFNHSLVEFINDRGEYDGIETIDWLHSCRMELYEGVNEIIKEHIRNEDYELIQPLKDHCKLLCQEALEIEMKVERHLF